MSVVLSTVVDKTPYLKSMNDYLVNSVYGLVTGIFFFTFKAGKTVNFDQFVAQSTPDEEEDDVVLGDELSYSSNERPDSPSEDMLRPIWCAFQGGTKDCSFTLGSIWWTLGGELMKNTHIIFSFLSLLICAYTCYRVLRRDRRGKTSVEVMVNVENDLRTGVDRRPDTSIKQEPLPDQQIKEETTETDLGKSLTKEDFKTFSFEHTEESAPNLEVEAGNTRSRRLQRRSISISRNRVPTRRTRRPSTASVASARSRATESPPPAYQDLEGEDESQEEEGHEVSQMDLRLRQAREEGRQQALRELQEQRQQNAVAVPNNVPNSDSSNGTQNTQTTTDTGTASETPSENSSTASGVNIDPQTGNVLRDLLTGFRDIADAMRTVAAPQNQHRPVVDKQKCPDFHGDEDKAFEWFREVERISLSNKWRDEDKVKVVPNHLKKKAQEWFYAEKVSEMDWPQFVTAFKKRFFPQDMKHTYRKQFNDAKRMPNETATEFLYRLKELAGRVGDSIDEQDLIQNYIAGVNNPLYQIQLNLNRQSLDRIIEVTKSLDAVEKMKTVGIGTEASAPSISRPSTSTTTGAPAAAATGNANAGQRGPRQGFTWPCANCGRPGHRYKYCNLPLDDERIKRFQDDIARNRANRTAQNNASASNPQAGAEGGDAPTAHDVNEVVNQTTDPAQEANAIPGQAISNSSFEVVNNGINTVSPASEGEGVPVIQMSQSVAVNGFTSSPDWPKQVTVSQVDFYKGIFPLPSARVSIEGYAVRVIFDTGSNKSAVRQSFAANLKNTITQWQFGQCKNFDGTLHLPREVVKDVHIQFNTREVILDLMVVPNLNFDAILGMDFIALANVDILPHAMHITTRDDPEL